MKLAKDALKGALMFHKEEDKRKRGWMRGVSRKQKRDLLFCKSDREQMGCCEV